LEVKNDILFYINVNFIQVSDLNFESSFHPLITGNPFSAKVEHINYVILKINAMNTSSNGINQLYLPDSF